MESNTFLLMWGWGGLKLVRFTYCLFLTDSWWEQYERSNSYTFRKPGWIRSQQLEAILVTASSIFEPNGPENTQLTESNFVVAQGDFCSTEAETSERFHVSSHQCNGEEMWMDQEILRDWIYRFLTRSREFTNVNEQWAKYPYRVITGSFIR